MKAVLVALWTRNNETTEPISESERENSAWSFRGLKYFNEKPVLNGYWIRSQRCK